jgi:DNA polymerase Ligase (LigD)
MPRFVILLHEMPASCSRATHYDLMFEHGPMLRTWALERIPAVGETVSAQRLDDHRPVYLDYEGEVSGDRGQVRRVDQGDYEVMEDRPERLVVKIGGARPGILTLMLDPPTHRWRVSLSGA